MRSKRGKTRSCTARGLRIRRRVDRKASGWTDRGGVRSAPRSTMQRLRVRAPGASFFFLVARALRCWRAPDFFVGRPGDAAPRRPPWRSGREVASPCRATPSFPTTGRERARGPAVLEPCRAPQVGVSRCKFASTHLCAPSITPQRSHCQQHFVVWTRTPSRPCVPRGVGAARLTSGAGASRRRGRRARRRAGSTACRPACRRGS